MTPEQLAAQLAQQADRASAAFARSLSRVWREAERRLGTLIRSAQDGPTATIRGVQAAALRSQLRTVLRDAGYDALAETATAAPLDRLSSLLLSSRSDLAELVARPRLEALQALHRLDLLDEGDALSRNLWDSVARGLFARVDTEDLLAELAWRFDRADAQIATLYDTAVSIYTRQVELLDAGDSPDTRYLYSGPDDEKTREFCQQHVGQTYTRAEIDALDNGQIGPVILTGGGYNCRHVWMEVSRFAEA